MNEQAKCSRARQARRAEQMSHSLRLAGAKRVRGLLRSRPLPVALLAMAAALASAVPEAVAARDGRLGRSSAAAAKIVLIVPERRPPRETSVQPACIGPDKARAFRTYFGERRNVAGPLTDTAGCVADPTAPLLVRGDASASLLTLEPE